MNTGKLLQPRIATGLALLTLMLLLTACPGARPPGSAAGLAFSHALEAGWDYEIVTFDAGGSTGLDLIEELTWDFGDGTPPLTVSADTDGWLVVEHEYAYSPPHEYTVTLTASGPGGEEFTLSRDIVVTTNRISAIDAGNAHVVALREDGTIWTWGNNNSGQLGIGEFGGDGGVANSSVPLRVSGETGLERAVAVAAGQGYTLAIDEDGAVWAWGSNQFLQLGVGDDDYRSLPARVLAAEAMGTVVAVSAQDTFSLALTTGGAVWAWGGNLVGQLGDNTWQASDVPVPVFTASGLASATRVAAGFGHALATSASNHVWAWGSNDLGRLGNGGNDDSNVPVDVIRDEMGTVVALAGGRLHSLAISSSGQVWSWGGNENGQLGDAGDDDSNIPVRVSSATGFESAVAVSASWSHSLAIDEEGAVWAWGWNSNYVLGTDEPGDRNEPVAVHTGTGLTSASAVAAAANSSYALQNGIVWAWGLNNHGQLGGGTTGGQRFEPLPISPPQSD